MNFVIALSNDPNPPLVNSMSVDYPESRVREEWKTRFTMEAMKLAARGITLVAASGDDGVANYEVAVEIKI